MARRRSRSRKTAPIDGEALLANLVEAKTAEDVIAAVAHGKYREIHDGGTCPDWQIPRESDLWRLFENDDGSIRLFPHEPLSVLYGGALGPEWAWGVGIRGWTLHERNLRPGLAAMLYEPQPGLPPVFRFLEDVHRDWCEAFVGGARIDHPLSGLVRQWLERFVDPASIDERHVIAPATMRERGPSGPRPLVRAPATVAFLGRPLQALDDAELETIRVDGEPLASRWTDDLPRQGYRTAKPVQGELLPGAPRTLDGERINDVVIATLAEARLTGDERATIRNDVHKLALAAYALTGNTTIPDSEGAIFIGGLDTPANRRRWRAAVAAARALVLVLDRKTLAMRDLLVASFHDAGVDIGPPSWWLRDGPAWRLTGGLWRPALLGQGGTRGPEAGYWGGLHRTVAGLESALTWGPTPGRGKDGRFPDHLRPERRGGPGPEVFIPWWGVLRYAGEPVDSATPFKGAGSGGAGKRYNERVAALEAAEYGYMPGSNTPAAAGDTIEIRRRKGGNGRTAGVYVRASARFVEAYRLGQDSQNLERLPARRLFPKHRDPTPETP